MAASALRASIEGYLFLLSAVFFITDPNLQIILRARLPVGLFPVGCDAVGNPLLWRRRRHKALTVEVSETLCIVGRAAHINILKFFPNYVCKVVWMEFIHLFINSEKNFTGIFLIGARNMSGFTAVT